MEQKEQKEQNIINITPNQKLVSELKLIKPQRKKIFNISIIIVCLILLIALLSSFNTFLLDFLVDWWWFSSLNYGKYFWTLFLDEYKVFAGSIIFFSSIFFLNFLIASRQINAAISQEEHKSNDKLLKILKKSSFKIYAPLSILLAIPITMPLYEAWEETLLFLHGKDIGITDIIYGKDISFYLLSYPVYHLVQNQLIITFGILFMGLFGLYWMKNNNQDTQKKVFSRGAKTHLTILALVLMLIEVWDFTLKRYHLQYVTPHKPLFSGPGFLEMNYDLPIIWISTILFILSFTFFVYYAHTKKSLKTFFIFFSLFIISVILEKTSFIPDYIDRYIVKPNQIIKEKQYIEANVESTLAAYGLDKVETREYRLKESSNVLADPAVREHIRNIPVWDRELLDSVYKQLQEIKPFYDFSTVSVDRYEINGVQQQVYLAPRELNIDNLPEDTRKDWINLRFQYTHGNGIVMTPAFQKGDQPMTWFMNNIPTQSNYGLSVQQPRIYYGLNMKDKAYYGNSSPASKDSSHIIKDRPKDYIIAPSEIGEIDHPNPNIRYNYTGNIGISLNSVFKKTLFSFYFGDENILFTTKTKKESKILFRRNVLDRVKKLVPYLELDEDPYIVVTNKGCFWIVDAYTTSKYYPNSEVYEKKFNYIRNSVKAVVDAYEGGVEFYISAPDDPIIKAFNGIYHIFKDMEEMPKEIKSHLRYPQKLFEIQMAIYAKYHQRNAEAYYNQADSWDFVKGFPNKSYYLTLNLFEPNKQDFLLLCPMSPINRDNLRSLVVAGCDGKNYGKVIVYSFPQNQQVPGPSQVSTLMDQDTVVSQALTLWNRTGSGVKRGKMIVLPIGGTVIYIQPVYLISTGDLKIPELKRIIVSTEGVVAMEKSLEEAFDVIQTKLKERAKTKS